MTFTSLRDDVKIYFCMSERVAAIPSCFPPVIIISRTFADSIINSILYTLTLKCPSRAYVTSNRKRKFKITPQVSET